MTCISKQPKPYFHLARIVSLKACHSADDELCEGYHHLRKEAPLSHTTVVNLT